MSLFTELKRRNVFRMAAVYAVAGWLIMQVAEVVIGLAGLPQWTGQALLAVVAIGFPIALIFSWFYELTPEGLSLEKDVEAHESITHVTGQRINYLVISLLCAGLVVFAIDKWWLREAAEPADAAAPVAYANSVAVLAFDDLSPDGDQGWFSDGLSEEIINSLAQLPELKVSARTSAFHFKGLDLPIPEIAAALGVAHVVEGSVRRAGDRMRVTAQLIKADDGFHLWSEIYDRPTDDVFAVQEDIAQNIAKALDIYLDEVRRQKMFQTGTRNVQAYEAYLRGAQLNFNWHRVGDDPGAIWKAHRWFEQALEHDPEFAQAHVEHSDAYLHFASGHTELPPDAYHGLTPDAAVELALRDYDRAIEFAHEEELRVLYKAERMFMSDDWSDFRRLLDKLGTIRETSTSPLFAKWNATDRAFALLGRSGIESNYQHFKKAMDRNPLDLNLVQAAAHSAMDLGKYNEAWELIDRVREFGHLYADYTRFELLLKTGRYDEFLAEPRTSGRPERALALVLAGRRHEARKLLDELLSEESFEFPHTFLPPVAFKELGEAERAAELIQALDNDPGMSSDLLTIMIYAWGGRLVWDLGWSPHYAARLAEMGVELEPYEFPPPVE